VFDRSVKLLGVANLLLISTVAAFFAVVLHRFIYEYTPILFLILPFFLLGVNWGLSNAAMITAVNQVIAPKKIGAALGTIATIWNIVGCILLATSTAIFHFIETRTSFLPAFHGAINFNIAFTTLILICAIWVYSKLRE